MTDIKVTVTDADGDRWAGQMATIESTQLGRRDHGVMTLMLELRGHGWGVGAGGLVMDAKPTEPGADRRATAYGLDLIGQVLRTVGVESWEDLRGEHVIALHDYGQTGWGSLNMGIASFNGARVLIWKKHAQLWRDEEGALE